MMASVFSDFKHAQAVMNGWLLAETITPTSPYKEPDRLQNFFYSTDSEHVYPDIYDAVVKDQHGSAKLHKTEIQHWVEVYATLWKVIRDMFNVQERKPDSGWAKVYDGWKELTNIFIKAYSAGLLSAWTIPCLYVTGKYLRLFAIRADEQTSQKGVVTFSNGLQDDIVGNLGRQEKLEDAAGVLSRIFTVCMNDR